MTELEPAAHRRSLLLTGGLLGAGAAMVSTLLQPAKAHAEEPANEPLINKWIRTKKITLGYEFGRPPMQYRDPASNEPAGYTVELAKLLAADLGDGITIDYVEVPFGQLFALLESGRCDMLEPVTNLPARALRGDFRTIRAFYAPVYVGLKPSSSVQKPQDLNAPTIRFATLQGTSQLAVARRTFPKAQFSSFPSATNAINEVASGRADATVQSSSSIVRALDAGARIKLLPTGVLYLESVSFFIGQGDPRTLNWLNNWMGYHASIGTLATLYERFVGTAARDKYKLQTVAVGPAGQAIRSNRSMNPDLVVAGSGAAGLMAALSAAVAGTKVLVLERPPLLGGTSAISGGQIWSPLNALMERAGAADNERKALTYLSRVTLGTVGRERLSHYLEASPDLLACLEAWTVLRFFQIERPDYHPAFAGACDGRAFEPLPYHTGRLGEWRDLTRLHFGLSVGPKGKPIIVRG